MKKFIFLTSVLALSACGGGSGGGSGPIISGADTPTSPVVKPLDTTGGISENVTSSNTKVTNMKSAINTDAEIYAYILNALGEDTNINTLSKAPLSRKPFSSQYSAGGTSYDEALEIRDMAEWLVDANTTREEIIEEFNKDSKKIQNALKLLKDQWCFVGGSAEKTADRIISRRKNGVVDDQEIGNFDNAAENLYNNTHTFNLKNTEFRSLLTTGGTDLMKLVIDDNGEIQGVVFTDDGSGSSEFTPPVFYTGLNRIFEKGTGTDKFDFNTTDENGLVTTGHATIKSYSVDSEGKPLLKYSDFGVLKFSPDSTINGSNEDIAGYVLPFIGGYEAKRIKNFDTNVTFTGTAHGVVQPASKNNTKDDIKENIPLYTQNATLSVSVNENNLTETFSADFNNWYKIDIIKTGNDISTTFDDTGKEIDKEYRFIDDTSPNEKRVLETGYYGDDGVATEATALFQYQNTMIGENPDEDGHDNHTNVNVYVGFGGVVDNNK